MRPSNFLLLDEPTNHLDLRAKDVLLEALQEYSGTLVFVSHDRYFIDKLATRVFEIADGSISAYPGNYEDYLWRKEHSSPVGQAPGLPAEVEQTPDLPALASQPEPPRPKRLNPIRLRQLKERRQALEEEIARLETGIAGCESALTSFRSAEETVRLAALLGARRADLEALLGEWEEVSEQIEASDA